MIGQKKAAREVASISLNDKIYLRVFNSKLSDLCNKKIIDQEVRISIVSAF
jgi:hypothetical protein